MLFDQGAYMQSDLFQSIPPLCTKTNEIINEVFSSPETVMTKFVLNVYHGKLQVRINLWPFGLVILTILELL